MRWICNEYSQRRARAGGVWKPFMILSFILLQWRCIALGHFQPHTRPRNYSQHEDVCVDSAPSLAGLKGMVKRQGMGGKGEEAEAEAVEVMVMGEWTPNCGGGIVLEVVVVMVVGLISQMEIDF